MNQEKNYLRIFCVYYEINMLFFISTGHYIYMDAAASTTNTSIAVLESPLIPSQDYCFEFYYYMFGADVGGE